ncbi:MAG: cytochrome b [Methylocella sp.]
MMALPPCHSGYRCCHRKAIKVLAQSFAEQAICGAGETRRHRQRRRLWDYGGIVAAGSCIMCFTRCLRAVPISGIVTLFAGGDGLPLFGFGEIPSPWLKGDAFEHNAKEIQETLANTLIILAMLHAGAALAHIFILGTEH